MPFKLWNIACVCQNKEVFFGLATRQFILVTFSIQYPELMVASYNNNEDAPHEPDGVALVWNMKFKKTTPEYVFHCQVGVSIVKITYVSY